MIEVQTFYHESTHTLTYLVFNKETRDAILIDPVTDYDGQYCFYESIHNIFETIQEKKLHLHAVLETHIHADHWSAAHWVQTQVPDAEVVIGSRVAEVGKHFSHLSQESFEFKEFSRLVKDCEKLSYGGIEIEVLATPGHTPVCTSFRIGEYVFVGDLMFMPDSGCGRCDFPGGSAEQLFDSVHEKIFTLPEDTKVMTGHDYQPGGRELQYQSSVKKQKNENVMININVTRDDFLNKRKSRDATLKEPKLLQSSLQVNLHAGRLPKPDEKGLMYLRIPFQERK